MYNVCQAYLLTQICQLFLSKSACVSGYDYAAQQVIAPEHEIGTFLTSQKHPDTVVLFILDEIDSTKSPEFAVLFLLFY
jgi:hypothetical protein